MRCASLPSGPRTRIVGVHCAPSRSISSGRSRTLIRTAFGSQAVGIAPGSVRLKTGDDVRDLPNDYVFVFAGGEPPFPLLRGMGVELGGGSPEAAAASADGEARRAAG